MSSRNNGRKATVRYGMHTGRMIKEHQHEIENHRQPSAALRGGLLWVVGGVNGHDDDSAVLWPCSGIIPEQVF